METILGIPVLAWIALAAIVVVIALMFLVDGRKTQDEKNLEVVARFVRETPAELFELPLVRLFPTERIVKVRFEQRDPWLPLRFSCLGYAQARQIIHENVVAAANSEIDFVRAFELGEVS